MTQRRTVWLSATLAVFVILASSLFQTLSASANGQRNGDTTTPIKHVIVIIGENHTFDNVFGVFQPVNGQKVNNLLSQGMVTCRGDAGPNVGEAAQQQATDTGTYSLSPTKTGAYATLPNLPDTRFPTNLPNAPFQITRYVPYLDSHVGDPIHRFYQMWQQQDEGKNDLYTWVANTAGDDNGAQPPSPINQGGVSMGYYNMCTGDAPNFNFIGDNYAISDNYHQSVMGGTGANHIMLGTGDAAFYSDGHGKPLVPPSNQIENPNAKPGTNNNYTQDGYAGGSYSNCSDPSQPGVGPVLDYLHSLPYKTFRNGDCAPGAYYLLNNYAPGYTPDGHLTTSTPFAVPPQTTPTIADELSAHGISWKYYGQGYNNGTNVSPAFCGICDPFQYASSIMTTSLKNNIQDYSNFAKDVQNNTLPAVSFIKPDGINDGHPNSSSLSLFETFSSNIVNEVISKPQVFKDTAIMITFDEGGGYYDSGYVQPTSFFGDGSRIPLMVVSPFAKEGYVDHTYYDHVSILKFIEDNWRLSPLSERSLDNLPNPQVNPNDPYKPINGPAIGNLMNLFNFDRSRPRENTPLLPYSD
jgi:acid phosphatase